MYRVLGVSDFGMRMAEHSLSNPQSAACCELLIWANGSPANGVLGQFCRAVEVKLIHQMGPMRLDRLDADVQHLANFAIGLPLGNQLQHLPLAGGQPVIVVLACRRLRLLDIRFDDRPGDGWAQVKVAPMVSSQ